MSPSFVTCPTMKTGTPVVLCPAHQLHRALPQLRDASRRLGGALRTRSGSNRRPAAGLQLLPPAEGVVEARLRQREEPLAGKPQPRTAQLQLRRALLARDVKDATR